MNTWSLHKPEDCPQTAASVAMETTASEATKDPLDLPVPLAFQETMGTMAIMEPLATKGPKVRKETKATWDHEGSVGSMAPKERRATRGFHQNCRLRSWLPWQLTSPIRTVGSFSAVLKPTLETSLMS